MWLPLPSHPGYWISSQGEVKRYGRPLKPTSRRGYLRVWLTGADGAKRMHGIHVLVLETFVGKRPTPRHHAAHSRATLDTHYAISAYCCAMVAEQDVRRVAVEAFCDPRTVRKFLSRPDGVRLSVRERIESALRKMRVKR